MKLGATLYMKVYLLSHIVKRPQSECDLIVVAV